MTLTAGEGGHHSAADEEVLPLMPTLQLDSSTGGSSAAPPARQPLLARVRAALSRVTPELLAIALVYFVQGILRLSSLAITFFEKDELHMEPTQMALADTVSAIPWAVKPLYGFITDSFPIAGLRRRPYLILAGLLGSASWALLAAFASSVASTVACVTAAAAATAFSDVVADSLVVELARASPGATEGALQSLCWASHAAGRVVTAYLSGWMVSAVGPRKVFVVTASFPLLVCLSSCLITEAPLHHGGAAPTPQRRRQERAAAADKQQGDSGSAAAGGGGSDAAAAADSWGDWCGDVSTARPPPGASANAAAPAAAVAASVPSSSLLRHQQQHHQHVSDDDEQATAGQAADEESQPLTGHAQESRSSHLNHRPQGRWWRSGNGASSSSGRASSQRRQQQWADGLHGSGSSSGLVCTRSCLAAAWSGVASSVLLFWNAIKQPHMLRPVLFLFLWQATPGAGTAMFYYKTNVLHFDAEFFGRVKLVVALADLLGIAAYNAFLKRARLRPLLLWGSLVGVGLGLTPLLLVEGVNRRLGISDRAFALVDSALLSSVGQVLLMPTLVLSARLCPEGVEATLYASLMSLNNAAAGVSDVLGAGMMALFGITSSSFTHLSLLLLTCNLLNLLPLPLIRWVPDESSAAAAAAAAAAGAGGDVELPAALCAGRPGSPSKAAARQHGNDGGP